MFAEPFRFQPLFRRYLWGGRRLGTQLGKPIGEGNDYAESWEIVDHGPDQSRVLAGQHAGKTLAQLVAEHGAELLGKHHPQTSFPLLFKFLDCHKDLSLQVHPNDAQAKLQTPPDLGKTEAWVILSAEPNSVAYCGLKPDMNRADVEQALTAETLEHCLHKNVLQPGDCLFIPAGVVHALGAGCMVAEIQQASDTTFRLYDWKRLGPDGKPRPLHIEQGLAVTNYSAGPISPVVPQQTECDSVECLVACDKFVLDRWRFAVPQAVPADDRVHLLAVLEGAITLENDPTGEPLQRGQTALLPASYSQRMLKPLGPTVLLDIYLP